MENLPPEIIIKIFSNCQQAELLRLSRTCSYFNSIITETKQLTGKLTVHFRNKNPKLERLTRKYQKCTVENFVDFDGENMQEIEIKSWNWSLCGDLLLKVFKNCPNLKVIKFTKVLFNYHIEFSESLQFKNILDLQVIESDSRIFKIFQHSKVHRLVYDYVPTGGNFPIPDMIEFLKVQDQLEDLTLSGFLGFFNAGIGRIIFHDSALSDVKFMLKRFTIKKSPIFLSRHFRQFLDLHMKNLKFLEITETDFWDYSDFVSRCESLDELVIGKKSRGIVLENFQLHPSIVKLVVDGQVDKKFLSNFPKLKILNVSKLKTEKDKFDEELICNGVEELTVEKTWLGGFFKFPKLRKLHLKNIRVMKLQIFDANPTIEELTFENCSYLKIDKAEIFKKLEKLKYFKKI